MGQQLKQETTHSDEEPILIKNLRTNTSKKKKKIHQPRASITKKNKMKHYAKFGIANDCYVYLTYFAKYFTTLSYNNRDLFAKLSIYFDLQLNKIGCQQKKIYSSNNIV